MVKMSGTVKSVAMLLILMAAFVLTTHSVGAQPQAVEEISKLDINVYVTDKAHVVSHITIKNIASNPLVPGVAEIRLQKLQPMKVWLFTLPFGERREPVKVENLKAYSGKMNIQTKVEEKKDYTVIYYEIWYPIKPGKTLNLTIEYDADLVDRGILFKTITIPVGADLDIKDLRVTVNSDWRLCYVNPPMNGSWRMQLPANHLVLLTAEFTVLPLPMLPVRGYLVVWGGLLAFFLMLLAFSLIRRRMRRGEREQEEREVEEDTGRSEENGGQV